MNTEQKKTILVADDDPDFLLQQEVTLGAAGYEVLTACSAAEAEEMLAVRVPDAMLVDLMMEESDAGFTLCYRAKRKYPDMPIIMVTGVRSETDIGFDALTREERSWIKADRLLTKPVRPEQVTRELEILLKG